MQDVASEPVSFFVVFRFFCLWLLFFCFVFVFVCSGGPFPQILSHIM